MAIICNVKLTKISKGVGGKEVGEGSYSARAEITDDTLPEAIQTEIVDILSALIDTDERKMALWENIWTHYQRQKAAVVDLSEIEADAKTYLEEKA